MDIKIEAPQHGRQDQTKEFYTQKLNEKLGVYDFIKAIDVKIKTERGDREVSLQLKPEKGKMLFAKAKDKTENLAFNHALKSIKTQIEKYKEVHYHSPHLVRKDEWVTDKENK
tara:strand:- start:167 stop:505 length:339 start_codon:yes stop_codon:yes gene_type:complete